MYVHTVKVWVPYMFTINYHSMLVTHVIVSLFFNFVFTVTVKLKGKPLVFSPVRA